MSVRSVLIVGAGARQHALAWRFAREGVQRIIAAPGNALMSEVAELRPDVTDEDLDAVVALALDERVDVVVVGPEDGLVAGLADRLGAAGVACFGPSAAAARLEGSKAFAPEVCDAAGAAVGEGGGVVGRGLEQGRAFDDAASAGAFVEALGGAVIVKADGLAGGKGVTLCGDVHEAEAAIRDALIGGRFGAAGRRVIVEEKLEGAEASVIALCDGKRFALLPAARDHKRAFDGDEGPNTGGMGAYSPLPDVDDDGLEALGDSIVAPLLAAMA